jgi:hypothetical protein
MASRVRIRNQQLCRLQPQIASLPADFFTAQANSIS